MPLIESYFIDTEKTMSNNNDQEAEKIYSFYNSTIEINCGTLLCATKTMVNGIFGYYDLYRCMYVFSKSACSTN